MSSPKPFLEPFFVPTRAGYTVSKLRGACLGFLSAAFVVIGGCHAHIPGAEENPLGQGNGAGPSGPGGSLDDGSTPDKGGVEKGDGSNTEEEGGADDLCGNGVLDDKEECDDGNSNDLDFCLSSCKINMCGDGVVQEDREECDDKNDNPEDACLNSCRKNRCGDGVLHKGVEECDDGNRITTDPCKKDCTINYCGDGHVGGIGEGCDDGNKNNGDGCNNSCQVTNCGNGVIDEGEQCDDGNLENNDACLNNCRKATCGDSVVWKGKEECDDGNDKQNDGCSNACKNSYCGDGVLRNEFEECDDGNFLDNDDCVGKCEIAKCGDGFHKTKGKDPEACDDGNEIKEDLCLPGCIENVCGDGIMGGPGEQCDDGNTKDGDDCSSDCKSTQCGNGKIDGDEQCDDGNDNDNDGCLSTCRKATCGDGYVQQGVEDCDPAASETSTCKDALGSSSGKVHNPNKQIKCTQECVFDVAACETCGDGTLNFPYEQCDGQISCFLQVALVQAQGYYPDPTAFATCNEDCQDYDLSNCGRCGDGVLHLAFDEECDDGNDKSNDDCDNSCAETFCGDGIVNDESRRKEKCDPNDPETAVISGTCGQCAGFFKPKDQSQKADILRCSTRAPACRNHVVDRGLCYSNCPRETSNGNTGATTSTGATTGSDSDAGGGTTTTSMPMPADEDLPSP